MVGTGRVGKNLASDLGVYRSGRKVVKTKFQYVIPLFHDWQDLCSPFRQDAIRTSGLRAMAVQATAALRPGPCCWRRPRRHVRGPGPRRARGTADRRRPWLRRLRRLPPGFSSLDALTSYLRTAFASRGLSNAFAERSRTLLIPGIDRNTAERVVFGAGELRDVPISQAVAASSAIPGFFDPYPIGGRDYVDGGTGFSGHADLAAEAGGADGWVVMPRPPTVPRRDRPETAPGGGAAPSAPRV